MFGRGMTVAALVALAGIVMMSTMAEARPGFYIGVGAAQQSASGDLDGTHSYADPSGNPQFTEGKLDSGKIGLTATVGYGFGKHFALEYDYADTQHTAKSKVAAATSDAELTTQVYAAKLIAPLGQRAEVYLKGGYGVYSVGFDDFAKNTATNAREKVTYSGHGTAWGTGLEFFFQELGISLNYTQHAYDFDRAKPQGSRELGLHHDLTGTATTADVMFTWYFSSL